MIDAIKKNIDVEIGMLREISSYLNQIVYAQSSEKALLEQAVASLEKSIKLVNKAIPDLIKGVDYPNKLPAEKKTGVEEVVIKRKGSTISINLHAKDKERFLKELRINESAIKNMKIQSKVEVEKFDEFRAARGYLKLSNKFFLQTSINLIKKGYFRPLYNEIKKANLDILFETYVATMLFTTFISFFVGIFITIGLIFFNVTFSFPFFEMYAGEFLSRFIKIFWIPIAVPIITFLALYYYPTTERGSISKRINQELPFAVIHMSAISGSGIPPSEIFKIIGLSKEYPFLRREVRKVLNQVNIYGYDLVTALTNVSKSTPSKSLSELFNGIATTINTGGSLKDFFEKRSETLLINYRFEREKFNQIAGTFMDIYISVVIAAPMILMLLLVMIQMTGIETGFSAGTLAAIIIMLITLINILFIGFLQIKQPMY